MITMAAVQQLWRRSRVNRRLLAATVSILALCAIPAAADRTAHRAAAGGPTYNTTLNYVIRFYPRWLTYYQQSLAPQLNRLTGPVRMGPLYGLVVAPNDDTIYAQFLLDLSAGPQVFTIPKTQDSYSLLTVDVWGNVLQTKISGPGRYALVPRGFHGRLPQGVTKVPVPYSFTIWIIRADKYSSSGQNLIPSALRFRRSLKLASLSQYESDPSSGAPTILPLALFAPRMKAIVDEAATTDSSGFLKKLQQAIHSSTTTPLSASDRRLSASFDRAFAAANAAAKRGNYGPISETSLATVNAHALIVSHWLSHVDSNQWIYFNNIGTWGTAYLDRASLSEFIQYGNSAATSKYYDAFTDHDAIPLDGSVIKSYQLTFPKADIPDAKRFWSLTAYIPPGITLVPNSANKYLVASYTRGLKTNRDGSITIYIQPTRPIASRVANWLPVPKGPFSLLLRVYGPTGNTASDTYVPPQIKAYGVF
jgi:hypothetical protein